MNERMTFLLIKIDFIKVVSDDAVLIVKDDEDFWIPRSCISYKCDKEVENNVRNMDYTEIRVTDWFARQKGLV